MHCLCLVYLYEKETLKRGWIFIFHEANKKFQTSQGTCPPYEGRRKIQCTGPKLILSHIFSCLFHAIPDPILVELLFP